MRYGLVDIGSNSVRLAVYDVENGDLRAVASEKAALGLVSHIKRGAMTADGVNKLAETLDAFRRSALAVGVQSFHVVATACFRNISNTEQAVAETERLTGVRVRVLGGTEEAMLDFYGNLPILSEGRHLLADLGGGSFELIRVEDRQAGDLISLPFGSLWLYKKFVAHILPAKSDRKDIRQYVRQQLTSVPWLGGGTKTLYAIGGSARAMLKLAGEFGKKLPPGGDTIAAGDISELCQRLGRLSDRDVHRFVRAVPDRLHVAIPGLLTFDETLRVTGAEAVRVSRFGLREGAVRRMVEGLELV